MRFFGGFNLPAVAARVGMFIKSLSINNVSQTSEVWFCASLQNNNGTILEGFAGKRVIKLPKSSFDLFTDRFLGLTTK